jgi:hypothetical protein
MMNRFALLALPAIFIPAGLSAQSNETASRTLEIAGEAPNACVIGGPATVNGVNATVQTTGASSQVRITQMVDATTAEPKRMSVDLSVRIICNGPHRVVLHSDNGGLLRAGASASRSQGGFSEFVAYEIDATWAGQRVQSASDRAGGVVIESPGGGAGQMSVSLKVAPGGNPLVAGSYSDAITIEFLAAT